MPADILSGKLLFIVIVILCSTSSFLLGYFVGKLQAPAERIVLSRIEEPGRTETEPSDRQQVSELREEEIKPVPAEPVEDIAKPSVQPESVKIDQGSSSVMNKSGQTTEAPPASLITGNDKPAGEAKAEKGDDKKNLTGDTLTGITRKEGTAGYYTIQVGAFGKLSDAERLRERLIKKGYSVTINEGGSKKPLYKVRVGRFTTRDTAETVAIKLTRAEGLKTFIVKD